MNQKTAKRLKKLCKMTSVDEKSTRERYQKLKKGWLRTPSNHRHALYLQLEKKSKLIAETIAAKQNPS